MSTNTTHVESHSMRPLIRDVLGSNLFHILLSTTSRKITNGLSIHDSAKKADSLHFAKKSPSPQTLELIRKDGTSYRQSSTNV
uniref:Uncharacterized protein n=1 Tax=Haemonchus placei TaxID=6290 RepID=A0A0N4WK39_HAEPC